MSVKHEAVAVDGGAVPVTVIEPAGAGPRPTLVVVPSIFGVTSDLEGQLAELDVATVVAMDPFWRVAPGPVGYDRMDEAMARVGPLDREATYADFLAVIAWARARATSNGRVVALGICFGGPFCLVAAADSHLDGIVTWHGSRMDKFLERAAEMRCAMRHHIGGDDPVVPPDALAALREAFAGRDDVELIVHEGATHGFSHRRGPAHQEAAERAGLASCRELLAG